MHDFRRQYGGAWCNQTAHDMVVTIVNEFAAVVAKENVNLDIPEVIEHVETCFDPTTIGMHFPSMHQDLIKITV